MMVMKVNHHCFVKLAMKLCKMSKAHGAFVENKLGKSPRRIEI